MKFCLCIRKAAIAQWFECWTSKTAILGSIPVQSSRILILYTVLVMPNRILFIFHSGMTFWPMWNDEILSSNSSGSIGTKYITGYILKNINTSHYLIYRRFPIVKSILTIRISLFIPLSFTSVWMKNPCSYWEHVK